MKTHGHHLKAASKHMNEMLKCLQCCANMTSQLGSTETYEATTSAIIGKRSKKETSYFFVYIIIN